MRPTPPSSIGESHFALNGSPQPRLGVREYNRDTLVGAGFGVTGFLFMGLVAVLGDSLEVRASLLSLVIVGAAVVASSGAFATGTLLSAVLVIGAAGIAQSALTTIAPEPATLYMDDAALAVVLTISASALLNRRVSAFHVTLFTAALVALLAVARAPSLGIGLFQFRQVFVPVVIATATFVAARTLRISDWRDYEKATMALATVVVAYIAYEALAARPIDPIASLRVSTTSGLTITDGVPNNYLFYFGSGSEAIERLGGPFMNPPAAGIFTGALAVVAFWSCVERRVVSAGFLSAALVVATVGTLSRGGMLVAAIGILLPYSIRFLGRHGTAVLMVVLAFVVGGIVAAQGNSDSHSAGLLAGVTHAVTSPLGAGFGEVGNAALSADTGAAEGESLAAIAFSAMGFPALATFIAVVWGSLSVTSTNEWRPGLAVALLLCTLFTESASSLATTALVWPYCGYALHLAVLHRRRLRVPFRSGGYPQPHSVSATS